MVILPRGSELVARGGEVVAGDVALTVARESTTEVDVFIAVGEGGAGEGVFAVGEGVAEDVLAETGD